MQPSNDQNGEGGKMNFLVFIVSMYKLWSSKKGCALKIVSPALLFLVSDTRFGRIMLAKINISVSYTNTTTIALGNMSLSQCPISCVVSAFESFSQLFKYIPKKWDFTFSLSIHLKNTAHVVFIFLTNCYLSRYCKGNSGSTDYTLLSVINASANRGGLN